MPFATEDSLERIILSIPRASNQAQARAFAERKRTNGRKLSTLVGQLNHVRAWGQFLGKKRFEDATDEDVRAFLLKRDVQRTWRPNGASPVSRPIKLADRTVELRKVVLRSFQAHVHGCGKRDPLPREVAWLEAKPRKGDDDLPVTERELVRREELLAMIEAQNHPQGKAILATLYDSAMRASEFCSLRIRNVRFDEHGAVLMLDKGAKNLKTGSRSVRILNATPYLRHWINSHPKKSDPNAALWLTLTTNGRGLPLRPGALLRFVQRAGREANVKVGSDFKPLWPHLFRHSRLTELAREGTPESELRIFAGWSRTSDQPAVYIHLSGEDVDKAFLRRAGKLKDGSTKHESALKPRVCGFCDHENPATATICENRVCGKPLTIAAAMERQRGETEAFLATISKDRALMESFGKQAFRQTVAKARRRSSGK